MDKLKIVEDTLNTIGIYRKSSLIEAALKEMQYFESKNIIFPNWRYLTLIQFAILYTRDSTLLRPLNRGTKRLVGQIEDIQNYYLLNNFGFKDGKMTRKTMSILAHQQFWNYIMFKEYDIARQMILFVELDQGKRPFKDIFIRECSIDFLDFLKLSYYFIGTFEQQGFDGHINPTIMSLLKAIAGEEKRDKFLNLLTIGKSENPKEEMNSILYLKSPDRQPLDITHWFKKPFLWHRGEYRVLSKNLFKNTIKYFLFDILKSNNFFQSNFSKDRFEKYIEMGLTDIGATFKKEIDLKSKYTQGEKIIDFLIEDRILVECKATELTPARSVNPVDDVVYNALKSSVVKGFEQIYEFSKRPERLDNEEQIGVIITYKPMYLGDGEDIVAEFLAPLVKKYSEQEFKRIPQENLYILSLDEWDKLMWVVHAKKAKVYDVLIEIRDMQKIERKTFEHHLNDLSVGLNISPFGFLDSKYQEFYNEVFSKQVRERVEDENRRRK